MSGEQQTFYYLSVSLAIGLLIGVERGWKHREEVEGGRIAGLRTYGLIGLLGGGSALLAKHLGVLALGLAFIALAGVLAAAYVANLHHGREDVGITSLVAALLTFVLGALAGTGEVAIAAASAVVASLLLGAKPLLHRWVRVLEGEELQAGIKLLLISVVLLPILPDKGYGPWHTLNPYQIWWMVVLIATISFVGYFAIKIGGPRKGAIFTGLFGGLASSTAVTLHFSRVSRSDTAVAPLLAMGILLACGTMLPRMLLVASVFNPELFLPLLAPAVVMAVLTYTPALFYWWSTSRKQAQPISPLSNPLELKTALGFGLLLALVMLLGEALKKWFGDIGVLALAAASGIADVDAITLSLARMSENQLPVQIAMMGIVIAAAANNLVKGGMATFIGGKAVGVRVGFPLLVSAIGGLMTAWLWIW
jgi:uncharacterized membrane protein (DUF4010 family)